MPLYPVPCAVTLFLRRQSCFSALFSLWAVALESQDSNTFGRRFMDALLLRNMGIGRARTSSVASQPEVTAAAAEAAVSPPAPPETASGWK